MIRLYDQTASPEHVSIQRPKVLQYALQSTRPLPSPGRSFAFPVPIVTFYTWNVGTTPCRLDLLPLLKSSPGLREFLNEV